ncbi:MAG: dihydroorotase [Thiohalomonadales bacterium]
METLTLTRPDDWHCHLRDDTGLQSVVNYTARQFHRCIVMPNLAAPIVNVEMAMAYRQRIIQVTTPDLAFKPLLTLYLTDNTPAKEIIAAAQNQHIAAIKYYPAGATTNSDSGVTDFAKIEACLATMEEQEIPLLCHGEVTDPDVDVFDREKAFIDRHLSTLVKKYPHLRVVFEHITTKDAVDFVSAQGENVAATITPQHLLLNRNAMLVGGIHPHHYCLPVLKRETHREALLDAATSANPKFFLGTDSAPHTRGRKESSCGCAGIFSAHAAMELYAMAFETRDALHKLEGFASFYGADFYHLARNTEMITLKKQTWTVPPTLKFADSVLVPFYAGKTLNWKLVDEPTQ